MSGGSFENVEIEILRDGVFRTLLIWFTDLVLAVRGQKNRGRGRGRERRKRDLAKYDCVGQNLAHVSTAHALNLTCFHVYSTDIEFDTALRFALKNAVL